MQKLYNNAAPCANMSLNLVNDGENTISSLPTWLKVSIPSRNKGCNPSTRGQKWLIFRRNHDLNLFSSNRKGLSHDLTNIRCFLRPTF